MNLQKLMTALGYLSLLIMLGAAVAFSTGNLESEALKLVSIICTIVWFASKICRETIFKDSIQ